MNERKAIVLLSGGLDSAVTLAVLKMMGYTIKGGVFVNRGQSNAGQEAVAVAKVGEYFHIQLMQANFSLPSLEKLLTPEVRKKLGIPARNLIFATLTLPYLRIFECNTLALGNITEDFRPDCDAEFRKQLSQLATKTLDFPISVVAPLADWMRWDKAQEIRWAYDEGYADLLWMTWTCWKGGDHQCGTCDACKSRREGFANAGVEDHTVYANDFTKERR